MFEPKIAEQEFYVYGFAWCAREDWLFCGMHVMVHMNIYSVGENFCQRFELF
jgi:hypothetical protein